MTDLEFQQERAGVFASAIGIARLRLKSGDTDGAMDVLDKACKKENALWRAYGQERGFPEDVIAMFLGDDRQVASG